MCVDAWGVSTVRLRETTKNKGESATAQVVPMENVRGRERVEAGEVCLRKNGRGVDTNRNWGVHWGFKEKDYDPEEEFPGSRPFRSPCFFVPHPLVAAAPSGAPAFLRSPSLLWQPPRQPPLQVGAPRNCWSLLTPPSMPGCRAVTAAPAAGCSTPLPPASEAHQS